VAHTLRVLCLNAGSSSLRLALYAFRDGRDELVLERAASSDDAATAASAALDALARDEPQAWASIDAVGHRIVHGGPHGDAPRRLEAAALDELRRCVPLAPLHLPAALAVIDLVTQRLPAVPQVACFDTAFHRRMPELAQRLPLPDFLWEQGVRRYGFHGLSFESVVQELGAALAPRTVIAHLGSGSSVVALRDGTPIDTTMSFTPAGGVMMATRSGDLDPGVLVHLLREGWSADRIERLVTQEAGLLAVSGRSGDMRTLLATRSEDPRSALAVAMYCHQVRKAIGALAAALGGLDLLVFTGGIGEGSAAIRDEICEGLAHFGAGKRSVVATNENRMIARHTDAVLRGRGATPSGG